MSVTIRDYYEAHAPGQVPGLWDRYWSASRADARRKAVEEIASISPRRILDVGCGRGVSTLELAHHAREVVGLDLAVAQLLSARRRAGNQSEGARCRFLLGDIRRYRPAETFDAVAALGVLGHYDDPLPLLRGMVDASHGLVVADLPRRSLGGELRRWLAAGARCPYHLHSTARLRRDLESFWAVQWETRECGSEVLLVGHKETE